MLTEIPRGLPANDPSVRDELRHTWAHLDICCGTSVCKRMKNFRSRGFSRLQHPL